MTQILRLVRRVYMGNEGFEGGTTGWSSFGTPSTFAQDSGQKHSGQYALKIVTATSTPRGGKVTVTIKPSTTYVWAVWSYLTAGSFKTQATTNVAGTVLNNADLGAADST